MTMVLINGGDHSDYEEVDQDDYGADGDDGDLKDVDRKKCFSLYSLIIAQGGRCFGGFRGVPKMALQVPKTKI